MQVDYMYLVLLSLILCSLFGMTYYSVRMLWSMKRGLLEKSWRYLCWGVVLASVGVVIVLISTVAFTDGTVRYLITNYFGVALATMGAMSFVLGFRSHTGVFHPKGFTTPENANEIPFENQNLNS